jgi:hypothetical protein
MTVYSIYGSICQYMSVYDKCKTKSKIMFWTEDHLHAVCKFGVTLWPLHYKSTWYNFVYIASINSLPFETEHLLAAVGRPCLRVRQLTQLLPRLERQARDIWVNFNLQAAHSLEAAMWRQTAAQLRNKSRVLGLRLPLAAVPALSDSQGSTAEHPD